MKQIQNHEASSGLVSQFGLRGRSAFGLDEVIVPTADVGDFEGSSPWEARVLAGDIQQATAVAVNHAGLVIIPAPGVIAVVEALNVHGVGTVKTVDLKIFRPVDLAAVTTISTSVAARLNGRMLSTGFAQQASTRSTIVRHTDLLDGALFQSIKCNVQETEAAMLPRGFVLDGTDPNGPVMLAVFDRAQNVALTVNYVVTEYVMAR